MNVANDCICLRRQPTGESFPQFHNSAEFLHRESHGNTVFWRSKFLGMRFTSRELSSAINNAALCLAKYLKRSRNMVAHFTMPIWRDACCNLRQLHEVFGAHDFVLSLSLRQITTWLTNIGQLANVHFRIKNVVSSHGARSEQRRDWTCETHSRERCSW